MHILVFETDFHRQRKYTDEGCAFLEAHGEVEIVRQIDQQDKEAFTRFLERVPVADGIVIGPWHRPATTPKNWQSAERMKVLAGTFDNRSGTSPARCLVSSASQRAGNPSHRRGHGFLPPTLFHRCVQGCGCCNNG